MTKEIFNEREERACTECYELVKYRDRAQLMTFIMRDDTRHSFGYDSLYGAHYFGHLIRVEFTRNTVVVKGTNMAPLHRAMTDHRVIYVRERPMDLVARIGEPLVDKISIFEQSGSDEKQPDSNEQLFSNHTTNPQKEES